jgi:O-antigen ligase
VNSYIAIALSGGLMGLGLFLGYLLTCMIGVFHSLRVNKLTENYVMLGKTLFATMIGVVIIIYTVSSILAIPILYWLLGGVCVAYSANAVDNKVKREKSILYAKK